MLSYFADSVIVTTSLASTLSSSTNQTVSIAENSSPAAMEIGSSVVLAQSLDDAAPMPSSLNTSGLSVANNMTTRVDMNGSIVLSSIPGIVEEGGVIELNPTWKSRESTQYTSSAVEMSQVPLTSRTTDSHSNQSIVSGEMEGFDWSVRGVSQVELESVVVDDSSVREHFRAVDHVLEVDEGGIVELITSGSFGRHLYSPAQDDLTESSGKIQNETPTGAAGINIHSEIGLHQAFELAESAFEDSGESRVMHERAETGHVEEMLPNMTASETNAATDSSLNVESAGDSHVHAASASILVLAALSMFGQQTFRRKTSSSNENENAPSGRRRVRLAKLSQRLWNAISSWRRRLLV